MENNEIKRKRKNKNKNKINDQTFKIQEVARKPSDGHLFIFALSWFFFFFILSLEVQTYLTSVWGRSH